MNKREIQEFSKFKKNVLWKYLNEKAGNFYSDLILEQQRINGIQEEQIQQNNKMLIESSRNSSNLKLRVLIKKQTQSSHHQKFDQQLKQSTQKFSIKRKNSDSEQNYQDKHLYSYLNFDINIYQILKRYINYVDLNQYNISELDDFQPKKVELQLYDRIQIKQDLKPQTTKAQYYCVKRNLIPKNDGKNRDNDSNNDTSDMPSLTEIQLNKQYQKSRSIQNQILEKIDKNKLFLRMKQFDQINKISRYFIFKQINH